MKIIQDDRVYLQKRDIGFMNSELHSIPVPVYTAIFGQGTVIVAAYNRDEFVCLTDPKAMEFVRGIDFLVDYDDVCDQSVEELFAAKKRLITQADSLADKYNAIPPEERKNHRDLRLEHTMIAYKIADLDSVIAAKSGSKKFVLPEGVAPMTIPPKKGFIKTLINKATTFIKK